MSVPDRDHQPLTTSSLWVCVPWLVVGACDVVFPLQPPAPRDATAAPCPNAVGHDEDNDDIDDACDNCPTIMNMDQANDQEVLAGNEADEVGDACDPQPTLGGDKIALFQSFTNEVGMRTGGSVTFDPDDVVVAGDGSLVATMMSFVPTKVATDVEFEGGGDHNVQLWTNSGGFRCIVTTMPCPTMASPGCLTAFVAPIVDSSFPSAAALTHLELTATAPMTLTCTARTSDGATATASSIGQFAIGQAEVTTVGISSIARVKNLVIYGQ